MLGDKPYPALKTATRPQPETKETTKAGSE